MPDELSISIDDGKRDIIADVAKCTTDKTVQDFVAGKTKSCSDAVCTYDKNDGWVTLADKSMFHEVDAAIAEKYDICKELRPDLTKPYGDSFYYHTDGITKKLLNRKEMLEVVTGQKKSSII